MIAMVIPEVWHTLSKYHNKFIPSRDVKMAKIQRSIVAGSVAILQIMEVFTQSSKPAVKDNAKAGLACSRETRGKALQIWLTCPHSIWRANYDLFLRRRDFMRPLLKQDLAGALSGLTFP